MTGYPDISLILPAYNERASIAATIEDIVAYFLSRNLSYEVIVSADGDDGTRELVAKLAEGNPRLRVMGHVERSGKGRGIREAVAVATGHIVGYVDADNKVDITEFEKLRPFLREGYDVVFGSRALAESCIDRQQPWFRRIGSRAFGVFMHAAVGLHDIADTQCGFKFFSRDAALRIFGVQRIDGYMFDVEILSLAQDMGFRLKQVPIRWRDDGDSRLDLISGNIRNVLDILAIRASKKRAPEILRVSSAHGE